MKQEAFNLSMMQRCLQLAKKGLGSTYPNPLVGCVITYNQRIIGEAWHQKAGLAHAEINAINSVKDKSLLDKATLFVNLEPCSHFGKTPPCANRISELKIPKVIIGCRDFASHVNGKGIEIIKHGNSNVVENILNKESILLNKRFFTFQLKKRPYIILKWAETNNGYFSPIDNSQKWITNSLAKQHVHMRRSQENAILIGGNTLRIDNPKLNLRLWKGNQPYKIIISSKADFNSDANIFSDGKIIIFNNEKNIEKANINWIQIDFDKNIIKQLLKHLYSLNIQSIIVEGGLKTLQSFIDENLWDEAEIYVGNTSWKQGKKAPKLENSILIDKMNLNGDMWYNYKNTKIEI